MPLISGGTAPYAPPTTVIDVVSRYRERGLSTPFTAEVLERAGVPETLSRRTLNSLKLLGFTDDEGNPAPPFEAASRSSDAEYKERLGQLLLDTYADVIAFADPASDSYERVRDAFRAYNPRGQQDRMVTLFLGLLDYVGLDTSAATSSRKRTDGGGNSAKKTNGARPRSVKQPATTNAAKPNAKRPRTPDGQPPQQQDAHDLPPGLVGLLQQIPRGGGGWAPSRRDEFMAAFKAVLDFSVPVRDFEPAPSSAEEQGSET